ncbi:MAG: DegT/DnrJ/EryC1/StrS family aminotransferase [Synergistaceae bacterium]|nr:DegT/DnrJ/EryC1/StrS family aminotransferase [Synergistaceae bacterium]
MELERIYLSTPHMSGDEIIYVKDAFDSNWVAPLGPHVDAFERETARYVGVKGALALSSGTAALHLASCLMGFKRGDCIFCSSLTFAATVGSLYHGEVEIVFIDSEPASWNMSPSALRRAFTNAEKCGRTPNAVFLVNLYGQSCDMDPILEVCTKYGTPVIEDAAESLGAEYKGKKTGSFGKYSILSYNGNKIITTSGGGMLLSDSLEGIEKAKFLSTQARDTAPWYEHSTLGYNYRMSNILAGIGRAQMLHLDERIAARRKVFDNYVKAFSDIEEFSFMPEPEWSYSNRWLTTLLINENSEITPLMVINELAKLNIESRPVWKPMHLQPVFKGYSYWSHEEGNDVSAYLFERGLCLPSGSNLTESQQERVIDGVRAAMKLK